MPATVHRDHTAAEVRSRQDALRRIEQRVLWLSTRIVHHANRVRPNKSGMKVGGHQASCASMVSLMTVLWFSHLKASDRVSVKPHASPVLHAINYLLGHLDEADLTTLREMGGLQSYPSRAKDPDPVDYSTGSVGIGATAPIWGALARRYVAGQFGVEAAGAGPRVVEAGHCGLGRQYSLLGDAELDEGACWEAILDPTVSELGEIVWIVDLNRQSLDRVVPSIAVTRLQGMFSSAGWQVIIAKYGRSLESLFARSGGDVLRSRLDTMSNPEYQRLLRCPASELVDRLPGDGPEREPLLDFLARVPMEEVYHALRNLGGHDLESLESAFQAIDDSRPTVIFAYTVKGYGLPIEGHPQNHSALLDDEQIVELARTVGADPDQPWENFPPDSMEADLCSAVADRLSRVLPLPAAVPKVPVDLGRTPTGVAHTQAALGRTLLDLRRAKPALAGRIVTVSPDVSSSTNLGGWVNQVGVWSPAERTDWFADDGETILHWRERPTGQHIELGIAETNLVGVLGELGATWSRWGQPLLPIGVVYDPFVERALEPWSFGIYAGGQSILVGTPSGVSLAPEGGAHQSIKTPSIGMEQPGCVSYEPAFAIDTMWTLLAALGQLGRPGGSSAYLRLSTRPMDQGLAGVPADPGARERRRRQVVAGGFPLLRPPNPAVHICVMGALVPEALQAAARLAELGIVADVTCITSPGLLFRALQARRGQTEALDWIVDDLFPVKRATPMVTLLDGHPHALAFLAGINQVPARHLGVDGFGQSGDLHDVYRYHGLDTDSVIRAVLALTE